MLFVRSIHIVPLVNNLFILVFTFWCVNIAQFIHCIANGPMEIYHYLAIMIIVLKNLNLFLFLLKGRETDVVPYFHLLVQSPNSVTISCGLGWTQEPRVPSGSPTWVAGTQAIIFCLLRCTLAGSWMGNSVTGAQTRHSDIGCGCLKQWLKL